MGSIRSRIEDLLDRIENWKRKKKGREGKGGLVCQTYLSDTADVLVPVLFGEPEVLVQAEAHIVAVQSVAGQALLEEVLLEGGGDGRLARGGQTGEPDGAALLLAEFAALLAGEAGVPGDVAGEGEKGRR